MSRRKPSLTDLTVYGYEEWATGQAEMFMREQRSDDL